MCEHNQVFSYTGETSVDVGLGLCYIPITGCMWQSFNYSWTCCDCPLGYIAVIPDCNTAAGRYGGLCVGCTDPNEQFQYNQTSQSYVCQVTTTSSTTTPSSTSTTSTTSTVTTPSCSPGEQFQMYTTSGDTCDFYTCLESEYHCEGTKYAYPLDYGLKYCTKYTQNLNMFSPPGKQWVYDVRLCLQNAVLPETDCKSSCQKIQDDAFKSHPACYVNNGVFTLFSDWIHIVRTVGIDGLRAGESQFKDTAKMCIAQLGEFTESELHQAALAIVGFLAQAGEDVRNAIMKMIAGQLRARLLELILSVGVPVAGL